MFRRILHSIHVFEDSLLIGLLIAMIVLASGQIFMRNLLEMGFVWIDPLLRLLVLWTGLIGATVASRDNRHIRIDLFSKLLPKKTHLIVQFLVGMFTTAVCAIIAWYGAAWVQMDYADRIKSFLDLPAWLLQIIIPIAFGLIALRYLIHSIEWLGEWFREQFGHASS